MRQQYGLRIQSDEFADMSWDEFSDLLSGLTDDTPLVRVAMIRTATDKETIKQMTPEHRRMRAEWQRRCAMERTAAETDSFLDTMQSVFARLFSNKGEGGA